MSFWSYCAPLRLTLSLLNFCAVYFVTLLGRCAILSLPVLGIVLLLRITVLRNSTFAKGAAWAALAPVLLLGKLAVYYESRLFQPLLYWQSWCCGYWWVCYGYLAGVIAGFSVMVQRRRRLRRMLRGLPTEEIDGQKVCLCALTVSPFTAGVLSPKIVLPTLAREKLSESELRTVLLHEQTHIRLGHLWCFLLWDILCALLWVNPFLRLATPRLKEDAEQVCDAVTIRRGGGDAPAYGGVLLKSMALLRDTPVSSFPVAFAGERAFADARERVRRVRDYRPYSRRRVRALAASAVCLLLLAALAAHRLSLPRYTELSGFCIVHVSEDVRFSTVYESETDEPPITLRGDRAEVDCAAFRALLPEDAPRDGSYYVMWGGFMKLPGIGGALNSVWVDAGAEGSTASVAFQDINDLFYVKLAKWI